MSNIIEVNSLVKTYRKTSKNAVDNISFSVKKGQFFALLGPNGAGKTTTISILTTILSKSSGDVKIAGFNIDHEAAKVRSQIGVIFQNPSLDLNLTAEENIRFHAVLYGLYPFRPTFSMMPDTYQKRVRELSSILSIEDDILKPVKNFSGGMKRKLEIVRSLMHKPKVLFLDEPTSGLDPQSRRSLWKYLLEVRRQEKTTIFLTTHYLDEAETADNIVVIDNGKIIIQGSATKIKNKLLKKYMIISTNQDQKLHQELDQLNLEYQAENSHYKVFLNDKNAQNIVQSIKTPLTSLQIHSPTLEEAYLKLISKNHE